MNSKLNEPSRPTVSVIIPAFNCADYIEAAIDSVFEQGFSSIEILVVDDGSTDSTLDVLRTYGNRIRVIEQVNSGSAVARNAGLNHAKGDYIAFLDSDDVWLPGKLFSQVNFLNAHPEFGLVCANWILWHSNDEGDFVPHDYANSKASINTPLSGWLLNELLLDCIVWTSTVVMRRSVYEHIGLFDVHLRRGQDYDYWLRVAKEFKIHKIDDTQAVYRIHDESITHIPRPVNYEYIVLKKAIDGLSEEKQNNERVDRDIMNKRLAQTCFSFAYLHYHEGNAWIAVESIITSIKYDPINIKYWKYLCAGVLKVPVFWFLSVFK